MGRRGEGNQIEQKQVFVQLRGEQAGEGPLIVVISVDSGSEEKLGTCSVVDIIVHYWPMRRTSAKTPEMMNATMV